LYWDIIAPNNPKRIFGLERFISLLISALAASFLTSCASVQGFPSDPSDSSTVLLSLQKYFTSDIEDQYYGAPNDEVRRRLRDRIVLGQMRGYDIQFANFQREIYGNSNLVSTGGDIVVFGYERSRHRYGRRGDQSRPCGGLSVHGRHAGRNQQGLVLPAYDPRSSRSDGSQSYRCQDD
jgi:hypothetical protein